MEKVQKAIPGIEAVENPLRARWRDEAEYVDGVVVLTWF